MSTAPAPSPLRRASRRQAIALSAMAWLLMGSAGADDIHAHRLAQAQAGEQFQQLLLEAGNAQQPQRLASEQALQLVRAITDPRVLLEQPAQGVQNLDQQMEQLDQRMGTCLVAQKSMIQLLMFGTALQPTEGQSAAEHAMQVRHQADDNSVRFQHLQQLLLPFSTHCLAHALPLLETLVASAAPRDAATAQRGLDKVRNGPRLVYLGGLSVIGEARYDPAFKQAVLSALGEDAVIYARTMPLAQRKAVAEQVARNQAHADAAYQADLEKIAAAFGDTDCSGLCAR